MESKFRNILRKYHPQGIPWPGTILYNAISRTNIFQLHYQMVADHLSQYCSRGRILDIGTGPGWLLLALRQSLPNSRFIGIDISSAMMLRAKKNIEKARCSDFIEVRQGAADELPFPDCSFDTVVSTGSIHHWKEPTTALNEIHRVLKVEGYALIYDLIQKMPEAVTKEVKHQFGIFRLWLLWLHSFEEPFYNMNELQSLAFSTHFKKGEIQFVGALCCLILKKKVNPR